jgi:hypothetical protein
MAAPLSKKIDVHGKAYQKTGLIGAKTILHSEILQVSS